MTKPCQKSSQFLLLFLSRQFALQGLTVKNIRFINANPQYLLVHLWSEMWRKEAHTSELEVTQQSSGGYKKVS